MWTSRAAATAMLQEASDAGSMQDAGIYGSSHKRRTHRRSKSWASKDSLADLMAPLTMSAQLEKVAGESLMLVGLAFNLWSYLGLGMLPYCMSDAAPFVSALELHMQC